MVHRGSKRLNRLGDERAFGERSAEMSGENTPSKPLLRPDKRAARDVRATHANSILYMHLTILTGITVFPHLQETFVHSFSDH